MGLGRWTKYKPWCLYDFYIPLDIISWQNDINYSLPCPFPYITPYSRGPLFGIDTNGIGACSHWMHSDVIYAIRPSASVPFTSWGSSNLATPITYEGAAQYIEKNLDSAEVFVFVRVNPGWGDDIMIMNNVPNNPTDISSPINDLTTTGIENNQKKEKINGDTLVFFYDNDGDIIPLRYLQINNL